ncbi:MAG: hypothetical protein ACREE0_06970 [Phenylobacterium sp.]
MAPPVVMMVSEVPQIDLSSLSRQQLQHLLETSRRAGRIGMADAVAQEMRERRAQPEAPRSWVEVDFSELASGPDVETEIQTEPQIAAEPALATVTDTADDAPEVAPRGDAAPVGPADPYAFSTLRTVPDGSLRINEPAPRRTRGRPRKPLARTDARIASPRPGRARAAMAGGVVALGLAAVAAMIPLQRSTPPPVPAPSVQVAAQAAPTPPAAVASEEVLPRASTMRLDLRGPITSAAEPPAAGPAKPAAAPASRREFVISAADLQAAAERANQAEMARTHAEGLQGTWLTPDFAPAHCRWSSADATLAVCNTRARYGASGPWRDRTGHYRRGADGAWQVAP